MRELGVLVGHIIGLRSRKLLCRRGLGAFGVFLFRRIRLFFGKLCRELCRIPTHSRGGSPFVLGLRDLQVVAVGRVQVRVGPPIV